MASLLLQHGADFNDPDSSKNYPLHYAAGYGYSECIDLLLKAGADPNSLNSWNLSSLCVAMLKNYFGSVKQLLSYPETDVNCKDDQGATMLTLSLEKLDFSMVERILFLLEKGASPNIPDLKGNTTIHHICLLKAKEIAKYH